jgi:hypothetical protein
MKEFMCSLLGMFCVAGEPIDLGPVDPDENITKVEIVQDNWKYDHCVYSVNKYVPDFMTPEEIDVHCEKLYPSQRTQLLQRFMALANVFPMPKMEDMLGEDPLVAIQREFPGLFEEIEALQEKHVEKLMVWYFDRMIEEMGFKDVERYVLTMETPFMMEVMGVVGRLMPEMMQEMTKEGGFMDEFYTLLIEYDQR